MTVDKLLDILSDDEEGGKSTPEQYQQGDPFVYDLDDMGNASFLIWNETYQLRPAELEELLRRGREMGMKFEEIPSCFLGDEWNTFRDTLTPNPTYDEILTKMAEYAHGDITDTGIIKDANIVFNFMDKRRRKTAESIVDALIHEEDESINVDGYAVTFEPHAEKPGKIRHLINGQR